MRTGKDYVCVFLFFYFFFPRPDRMVMNESNIICYRARAMGTYVYTLTFYVGTVERTGNARWKIKRTWITLDENNIVIIFHSVKLHETVRRKPVLGWKEKMGLPNAVETRRGIEIVRDDENPFLYKKKKNKKSKVYVYYIRSMISTLFHR